MNNNGLTWKKILVGVDGSEYDTPKVISDMAKDEKFDLVVVGSRGMGAIKVFLIGSVCSKICYDSPISVLIVK